MSVIPVFDANSSSEGKEVHGSLENEVEGKRCFTLPWSNLYVVSEPS